MKGRQSEENLDPRAELGTDHGAQMLSGLIHLEPHQRRFEIVPYSMRRCSRSTADDPRRRQARASRSCVSRIIFNSYFLPGHESAGTTPRPVAGHDRSRICGRSRAITRLSMVVPL